MLSYANQASFRELFLNCSSREVEESKKIALIDETYRRLELAYNEPHRVYHSMGHIDELLGVFEEVKHLANDPRFVKAGIWWHDAIYEIGSKRNEFESANWCIQFLLGLGCDARFINVVAAAIYATTHSFDPVDNDARMIASIDLSPLAKPWDEFLRDGAKLYTEYVTRGKVPEEKYWEGRDQFLKQFIMKPTLYCHPELKQLWEMKAKGNIVYLLDNHVRPINL